MDHDRVEMREEDKRWDFMAWDERRGGRRGGGRSRTGTLVQTSWKCGH